MKKWFSRMGSKNGRLEAGPGLGEEYPDHFLLDYGRLHCIARNNRESYVSAGPFPHIIIEDLINSETLDLVLRHFLNATDQLNWRRILAKDRAGETVQFNNQGLPNVNEIAPVIRQLIWELNSGSFIRSLEMLTGIKNLLPDPDPWGGIHQILPGGILHVHADFTHHVDYDLNRRINVLLYLNKNWRDEYEGHLELWDQSLTRCVKRFRPTAGRCVIFNINDNSFHGYPRPLTCPKGVTQKSINLYYYTIGRSDKRGAPTGTTDWKVLPEIELPELQ